MFLCTFSNVPLHHPYGKKRTGDIQPLWVDVTTAAGPILLKLGRETNRKCFGAVFEISLGTKNRGLNRIQTFFAEVLQITRKIRFTEEKLGLGPLSIDALK